MCNEANLWECESPMHTIVELLQNTICSDKIYHR